MDYSVVDIQKLAELLKPPTQPPEPTDDLPKPDYTDLSKIQTEKSVSSKNLSHSTMPRSLEEFEEQMEKEFECLAFDNKKEPKYEIKYRQAVTAEDVFLQIGLRNPSSASCEDMIVQITLPDENISAINLILNTKSIEVEGYLHKLFLNLPHAIDTNQSKATWEKETEILTLTLRIVRELDFVNF